MLYYLIPLIIGMVLFTVFLFFRVKEERKTAVVIKGAVSLLFIATALVAWLTSKNPHNLFGLFIILGLFFGLLGDVFLDLKYIILEKEMFYTILGFCAFAVGHIFYTTGLLVYFYDFNSNILYLIIPLIITAVLMAATLLMEKVSTIRYLKMKPFVIMYGFFLFFTTSIFFSAAVQSGWQNVTVVVIAIALISFMISDLILNNTYFAPGFNTPLFVITNHIFYYVAQFAIAVSLFYLI